MRKNAENGTAAAAASAARNLDVASRNSLQVSNPSAVGLVPPSPGPRRNPVQRLTARLTVLAEGDYDVAVPTAGQPLATLLESLGIGERATQLYVDGRVAGADSIVRPGSRVDVLPAIRGG